MSAIHSQQFNTDVIQKVRLNAERQNLNERTWFVYFASLLILGTMTTLYFRMDSVSRLCMLGIGGIVILGTLTYGLYTMRKLCSLHKQIKALKDKYRDNNDFQTECSDLKRRLDDALPFSHNLGDLLFNRYEPILQELLKNSESLSSYPLRTIHSG